MTIEEKSLREQIKKLQQKSTELATSEQEALRDHLPSLKRTLLDNPTYGVHKLHNIREAFRGCDVSKCQEGRDYSELSREGLQILAKLAVAHACKEACETGKLDRLQRNNLRQVNLEMII